MKQKSIKNIRQEFKEHGIFYTPPALAQKLRSYVNIEPNSVYDPTCGAGNLLSVFPDDIKKYGQELDVEQLGLIKLPNFTGYAGDTLSDDKFAGMEFDCIVANPPFSVKWNPDGLKDDIRFRDCCALPPHSKADWAFMLHILHHLSAHGVAVVLGHPGILYRQQREGAVRKWFVENNFIDRIVNIPGKTFEDTAISTCIIVLKKDKTDTDVTFEDGERTIQVTQKTVIENGFILSVNTYLPAELPEKEETSLEEITLDARQKVLSILRDTLELEKIFDELEGISIQPFIDGIKEIIKDYEVS